MVGPPSLRTVLVALGGVAIGLLGCRSEPAAVPSDRPPIVRARGPLQPFRMGRPDIVLLVTGGTNAVLEPCHCAGEMPGGYSRRNGLLRLYRRAFPNVLLVDTGDAFVPDRPASLRNHYVIRGYARMGYDALVLGDQEWAVPNYILGPLLAPGGPAYLSTTVTSRALPDLPTTEAVTREWDSTRIAVVSDNHDRGFRFMPASKRGELEFLGVEELGRRVDDFKRRGYVVVVAAHGDNLQLAETARTCRADLILWGNTLESERKVLRVEGRPVVKVGSDAHLGAVALRVEGDRIRDLEYRLEVVGPRWPFDWSMMKLYEEYMKEAMPAALRAPKKEGLAYVSSATCGRCHVPAYEKWKDSGHAHAYEILVRKKRTGDPQCVGCHTTGFGTKAGFTTPEETPDLAGVGCQVCHPIGLEAHVERGEKPGAVSPALCLACHTKVTDPRYEHGKRWSRTRCPPRR